MIPFRDSHLTCVLCRDWCYPRSQKFIRTIASPKSQPPLSALGSSPSNGGMPLPRVGERGQGSAIASINEGLSYKLVLTKQLEIHFS